MMMPKPSWIWTKEHIIPSETGAGKCALEDLLGELVAQQWGEHDVHGIHLALEEALVNAIRHGNRSDASKNVYVCCKLSDEQLWVEIRDEGAGFDADEVPDCTDQENIDLPSGRGIMLMRAFMSSVEYNDRGNCVVMKKYRAGHAV